jgi:hypothetical protein
MTKVKPADFLLRKVDILLIAKEVKKLIIDNSVTRAV